MTKIVNPTMPFMYIVPSGHLQVGQQFVIEGESTPNANRFCINFIQNLGQRHVFHLDFRFDQGETVRNTDFPYGQWGQEERSPLPIQRGRRFKIELKVHHDRYEVYVDGRYHCDFRHRAPNTVADCLHVKGDAKLHKVKLH